MSQNPSAVSKLDPNFSADALPYFDGVATKEQKAAANALIDEELKRFPCSKDYLADFVDDSEKLLTPALREMLVMAERNVPLDAIDDSRFIVPDVDAIEKKDLTEALKSLELVEAQVMYADQRSSLLSLIQKHGSADYRIVSGALKASADAMARKATEAKRETFDIHRERKSEQAYLGKRIAELEAAFEEGSVKVNGLRDIVAGSRQNLERLESSTTDTDENTDPN